MAGIETMSGTQKSMTVFEKVYARKWKFIALFTLAYFLSLIALDVFGYAPWSGSVTGTREPNRNEERTALEVGEGEEPVRVEIPKIGIRTKVGNPESAQVSVLDAALLSGAVRYPGSAKAGEEGNMLLFGHSSRLPVVQNQAFKAFNDIQKLEEGDPIFVIGSERVYIYAVEKVEEANTATDAVPLSVGGAKLTLATCNNFGSKEDRFIVTANLVEITDVRE